MRVFVAGGTGFVGTHVCRELLERGHLVRLLCHRRRPGSESGLEQVSGDVTRLDQVAAAMEGCQAAINLVGIIREFPGRRITYQRLHLGATETMLAAAERCGVQRYLQMSALGSRAAAVSRYHLSKFQAEEAVRASRLDATIFRPSLIFGPGDEFVTMLAGQIRRLPAAPVIGDGQYRLQPIAARDVARCFAQSLEMPETIGRTFELCGSDCFTYRELLECIGTVLGKRRVRMVRQPLMLLKLIVPLMEQVPFFPLTMDQLTMLLEESVCDGGWRSTFTFQPTRFVEGIREYLRPGGN